MTKNCARDEYITLSVLRTDRDRLHKIYTHLLHHGLADVPEDLRVSGKLTISDTLRMALNALDERLKHRALK